MRLAMACVICAEPLEQGTRADCRYCGARCRMRAYRVRLDAGGRLRSDAQRRHICSQRQQLQRAQESLNAERTDLQRQQAEATQRAEAQDAREAAQHAAAAAQRQATDAAAALASRQLAEQAEKIARLERMTQQRAAVFADLASNYEQARQLAAKQHAAIQKLQGENSQLAHDVDLLSRASAREKKIAAQQADEIAALKDALRVMEAAQREVAPLRRTVQTQQQRMELAEAQRRQTGEQAAAQAQVLAEREQQCKLLATELSTLSRQSQRERTELQSQKREAERQAAEQIAKLSRDLDEANHQIAKWRDPAFRELLTALIKEAATGAGGLAIGLLRQRLGLPEPEPPSPTPTSAPIPANTPPATLPPAPAPELSRPTAPTAPKPPQSSAPASPPGPVDAGPAPGPVNHGTRALERVRAAREKRAQRLQELERRRQKP